jgi:hypothetical protein
MKVKLFGLFFILGLWVLLNFGDNSSPIKEATINQNQTPGHTKVKLKKIETHGPQENRESSTKTKKNIIGDDIPWEELDQKWQTELKDLITGLDHEKGEKRFKDYLKAREGFNKQLQILMNQREATFKYDSKKDSIIFKDQKRYDELNIEIDQEHKILTNKAQLIFSEYYPEAKALHDEFGKSIQAYNHTEGEIAIDPAFTP